MFTKKEQNFITEHLRTKKFTFIYTLSGVVLNCHFKIDCSDCIFVDSCIVGGTPKQEKEVIENIKRIAPEFWF